MSAKLPQGKTGIVATKKSDSISVSNALFTESQNKSGSNESLASEMETVIIQGTDFAKEFEKPNDRASHIKIGRAKQKVISGGQGSVLQCTSVTSGNAAKPTGQKATAAAAASTTTTKPRDGACRTSDLEGSAGNSSCAAKSALKKATPTGTASLSAPSPVKIGGGGSGHIVASKPANVNVSSSSKHGNIANATKNNNNNNMLLRPPPPPSPAAVSSRPVEVAANIGHRPNFNMRSTHPPPSGVFPGSVPPRGRGGPAANFNPQRPTNRMPSNLFNAGRPNVQVVNVRNPRPMNPGSGFNSVRPALGLSPRQTGPRPVRLTGGCPVNKMDVRRPNAPNSTIRQRAMVPDKASCLNTRSKATPAVVVPPKTNKMNSINDRLVVEKVNPANKTIPHSVTTKTSGSGILPATTPPPSSVPKSSETGGKVCNHTTGKQTSHPPAGTNNNNNNNNKGLAQSGNSSSSSINSNNMKLLEKSVPSNLPNQCSQQSKVNSSSSSSNNTNTTTSTNNNNKTNNNNNMTSGNKTVKTIGPKGCESTPTTTTTTTTSSCVKVESSITQKQVSTEKDTNLCESSNTCDINPDALDDIEGSKGGISFSFNRKMGQKLPSSVPFGKEDEKALNSVEANKDSKIESVKEGGGGGEKSQQQQSNKEISSSASSSAAGMSFLKVLNKEQTLELDWPVEMIQYTKTQPSLSYSCNPLFFDFKELLSKDKSLKDGAESLNQMKSLKSEDGASLSKMATGSLTNVEGKKDLKVALNLDSKPGKKSRKKNHKLSSSSSVAQQAEADGKIVKSKKKKKKKHRSKKRGDNEEVEGGVGGNNGEKDEEKTTEGGCKVKRHKKKKKKKKRSSHHSGGGGAAPPDGEPIGHGDGGGGGDGDGNKSKSCHKSKHKKHHKSKKKRHKGDESNSGHESEEEPAAASAVGATNTAPGPPGLTAGLDPKNKKHKKRKPSSQMGNNKDFSSDEEVSKVQKAKMKLTSGAGGGMLGDKSGGGASAPAGPSSESDGKHGSVAVCQEEKDVMSKKRTVGGNNPSQLLESVEESKKLLKKDEVVSAAKPGSVTERKRPAATGDGVESPSCGKKKKLSSKSVKSEDTWSKMETIFEARSDPDGNKASWDTSSDSDMASHDNKSNVKMKSTETGKRKRTTNPLQTGNEKTENKHGNSHSNNPASKTNAAGAGGAGGSSSSNITIKVEPKTEIFHNSSGSDSDRPTSSKPVYKRKKSYSGESHHSDSHCRSRERSYSSSYSDRDSHYSGKSKRRRSRSHSSSRSRSRSRSASYERHSSRRGRRYSYSSYSDEDYRYRRGHSRSRSCSRRRSRTRSRSYSRSRRYRSYSSEHHRSYSSSSSRSRSRSESRGRSRSYSYSRSHSKSTSYSRSRSRSRSYHKSRSRSRSPHKSSKQDYRHKASPERNASNRYYSSKKNSKHLPGTKGNNEKTEKGKLDPAQIPLPIMPGDVKEEVIEGGDKKKKATAAADSSLTAKTASSMADSASKFEARKDHSLAATDEPEAKSGLINIPLPPFQMAENAQLTGKVDSAAVGVGAGGGGDGQLQPPPPPPHLLSLPHYPPNAGDCLMHHPIPDLSQPPPSTSLMANCPPPPPPPPPPLAARLGASSLYGHLGIPPQDVPTHMNVPPPPPPPKCGMDPAMRMPLPFTPRSVSRLELSVKEAPTCVMKSTTESTLQVVSAPIPMETEKEMTPPLPPPKSPPPQPPPPPKKEDEKKNCEEISPMQPIIPPEQVEQYKHLQEMAQKHALKQQRRQRLKDTGQAEESDVDDDDDDGGESMEMEGQVSTLVSDEECEEPQALLAPHHAHHHHQQQAGVLALPEPEPQHLQRQILLPHAQHAASPVIAQHVVPFSQQQIIIPPSSLLQSQGAAFPIQTGGPMIAIPHSAAAHHHHHHHHHPLAGHHALHHAAAAFHPAAAAAAAAAGMPLAAAAASHPFHHQLIAAAPGQLVPYSSPQPILTQLHPPGPIIIGHQVLIPRFPRTPM